MFITYNLVAPPQLVTLMGLKRKNIAYNNLVILCFIFFLYC